MLKVNCRNLANSISGVQRYTIEIVKRLPLEFEKIQSDFVGIKGHLWEQLMPVWLPREDLLWSPANTGPIYRKKHVVTIHDAATLDCPAWFERKFAKWYQYMLPRLCHNASGVITVSEYSKSRLVAFTGVEQSKIKVIYNGISERFIDLKDNNLQKTEKAFYTTKPFVLFVGSLDPRKNLERLLLAWERIENPDFDLVIAGSGNRVFKQERRRINAKNVVFIGRVSDNELLNLYASAYAFIYPSLYEGFGLPPLEAMASGCPVATSATSSLPEVCGNAFADFSRSSRRASIPDCFYSVENNDVLESTDGAVIYFNPYDINSIAQSIECLLTMAESERNVMIESAKKISSTFTWRKAASETSNYLSSFC